MIDSTLLRLTALEKDLNEAKQALGQSFLQNQAMKQMLSNMYNYLTVKSVIDNKGDRDAIIEEMKVLNKTTSDADFDKMVIPLIDYNIKIYKENLDNKE